jgi:uncharacterized protein (DUF1800 family)
MAEKRDLKLDPAWAWAAYKPSAEAPWNLQRVGHLYRRAAFGADHATLQAGLEAGPAKTIDRLLQGGSGLEEFDKTSGELAETIARGNNPQQLRAWWLNRMLYTPHPLREKLTLFWHNHFATSNAKVQSTRLMLGQFDLMQRHAQGNFGELLQAMSKDPAMLVWLDGKGSKKGNPNENYAREIMELFALGIGHYTEKDIREAARAFSGWDVVGNKAVLRQGDFDDGSKTFLGQTGRFGAEDIVRICLEQEAAAPFILTKLFKFLVSESVPATPELLAPLATEFRGSKYDFGAIVSRILRSNLFFADSVYRTRIKSPVEFAVGIVRALEGRLGTSALATSLGELGQDLFYPPNVKGWDGGEAWLNAQTLLFRQNLSLALTSTADIRFGARTDPAALVRKLGKTTDEQVLAFFLELFLQNDVPAQGRTRLQEYQKKVQQENVPVYWTPEDAANHRVRALCHLVLTLPEFQLS